MLAPGLRVPAHFIEILLSIEDKRFLLHPGVDPLAVLRSALRNVAAGGIREGASSITQQLFDVAGPGNSQDREASWSRKFAQAAWAAKTERASSKSQILALYLSRTYWGRAYVGLDAACEGYFGVTRSELTVSQGFFLVDRLAAPNRVVLSRLPIMMNRRPVQRAFSADAYSVVDLVRVYDRVFGIGEDLCQALEKSRKR